MYARVCVCVYMQPVPSEHAKAQRKHAMNMKHEHDFPMKMLFLSFLKAVTFNLPLRGYEWINSGQNSTGEIPDLKTN